MCFRSLAAAVAALMLSAAPATAITYQYTGQTFTVFDASEYWPQPHNSNMSITALITMANPLAASTAIDVLSWTYDAFGIWTASLHPDFVTATLNDGVNSFSFVRSDSDIPGFPPLIGTSNFADISLITDALGNITSWLIRAGTGGRYDLQYGSLQSDPSGDLARTYGYYFETSAAVAAGGSWSVFSPPPTVVPLPAGAWLLFSGLIALKLLARSRSHSSV